MTSRSPEALSALVHDLAYHQSRVLLLVQAVADEPGNSGKLDGLTKLAKLDFLVRYPALAPVVLDELSESDPDLHLSDADLSEPTVVSDPMTRYKYVRGTTSTTRLLELSSPADSSATRAVVRAAWRSFPRRQAVCLHPISPLTTPGRASTTNAEQSPGRQQG